MTEGMGKIQGKCINCNKCGKEFYVKKSHLSRRKYCSAKCFGFTQLGKKFPERGLKISISNRGKNFGFKWSKGHLVSEETRKKIGLAHKGLIYTKESREKMSNSHKGKMTGEENPRYTGFINNKYRINALERFTIRQLVLERDMFKCQSCGKSHHEKKLDIHHKIPLRISDDNSLNNLVTLCRSCHQKEEFIILEKIKGGKLPLQNF